MEDGGNPRACRGRRYRWRALWATLLLGMTRCTTGLRGLEDDCKDFGPLARCLGACQCVGHWALGNFLRRANPAHLRANLWKSVHAENRRKSLRPVGIPFGMMAVDGKQGRRALSELVSDNVPWVHPAGHGAKAYGLHRALRSASVSNAAPVVLDTAPVCGKTNETRVFFWKSIRSGSDTSVPCLNGSAETLGSVRENPPSWFTTRTAGFSSV